MIIRWLLNVFHLRIADTSRIRFVISFVVLTSLISCAPNLPLPPPVPVRTMQHMPAPHQVKHHLSQVRPSVYRVGPGDVIQVRVDGKSKLSRDVMVDADGMFHYPKIGRIQAGGLTLSQIDAALVKRIVEKSGNHAPLSTKVIRATHQSVNVLGEVRIPGLHPLKPQGTLMDILSRAGGPTRRAGWVLLVMRNGGGGNTHAISNGSFSTHQNGQDNGAELRLPIRVDLEKLVSGEHVPDLMIGHGDTLFIPEAGEYFVYGDVNHPGEYRLRRDTTVVKAVARAGGFTRYGSEKGLSIWRHHLHQEPCEGDLCLWGTAKRAMNEPPQRFRVGLHDRLQPGDIVVVR